MKKNIILLKQYKDKIQSRLDEKQRIKNNTIKSIVINKGMLCYVYINLILFLDEIVSNDEFYNAIKDKINIHVNSHQPIDLYLKHFNHFYQIYNQPNGYMNIIKLYNRDYGRHGSAKRTVFILMKNFILKHHNESIMKQNKKII